MGIKEEIDKLTEAELSPEPPVSTPPVKPPDPTKAEILAVVERLTKPWVYGKHYERFARDVGVSLAHVREIADEVERRKKELSGGAEMAAMEK